ncbi:MAG: PAS domain-containing protein [Oscillospiraceae bacterium]|nr:PAS domain-containing protein [Oscillospiraceae bacterium]
MSDKHAEFIWESIMRDMSEGVMAIGMDGEISYVNPAAERILDRSIEELTGQKLMQCFFGQEGTDAFIQTILDAIYDTTTSHRSIVPYVTEKHARQLHVTTSYLRDGSEKIGVVVVISDISELTELRDTVKVMEQIKALNTQLELRNKLLNETFGRFLSDEIVRQLLETPNGLALGGKKRTVTILLSDLRGFTAISERMEAQDIIAMLNHYLGEMTEVIRRYKGTVIEFIGDGIMAIFGAPLASDRHAADAVAAAVAMQARMDFVNAWNAERGYPLLEMGIGVNTGEVIVGNIGSERHTKYGVVGSHVNLAGRIESYSVGGQVLVSPTTRALISEPLEVEQEQTVFPKGVREPLVLSHITGIGGEYTLSCKQYIESPEPLEIPRDVLFLVIRDKHNDLNPSAGRLTALSKAGAIMETDAPIVRFDNLQLEAGGELYCKVMSKMDNGWLLRFTAVPPGFDSWCRGER